MKKLLLFSGAVLFFINATAQSDSLKMGKRDQ